MKMTSEGVGWAYLKSGEKGSGENRSGELAFRYRLDVSAPIERSGGSGTLIGRCCE